MSATQIAITIQTTSAITEELSLERMESAGSFQYTNGIKKSTKANKKPRVRGTDGGKGKRKAVIRYCLSAKKTRKESA